MGDNVFSSREQMLKQAAQAAYNDSYNKMQSEKDEAEMATQKSDAVANLKDELVKGITEPIGGLLVGKPFEKVINKGAKKLLGKGVKLFKDKAMEALKNASNGDLGSFGKNLSSKTTQNIKDLLGDDVPESISKNFSKLSSKAQSTINAAREKLGKKKIGQDDSTTENDPVSAEDDVPAIEMEDIPEGIDTTDVDALKASKAAAAESDAAPDAGYDGSEVENVLSQQASDWDDIANGDFSSLSPNKAASSAEASEADAQPSTKPKQPDAQDDGDPSNQASGNAENTDRPTDNLGDGEGAESGGTETGTTVAETTGDVTDVTSGLEDAAAGIEAAAGAEGGLNIFADIAAGIAGLATLIAGATAKAKPKPTGTPIIGSVISSGVQLGI